GGRRPRTPQGGERRGDGEGTKACEGGARAVHACPHFTRRACDDLREKTPFQRSTGAPRLDAPRVPGRRRRITTVSGFTTPHPTRSFPGPVRPRSPPTRGDPSAAVVRVPVHRRVRRRVHRRAGIAPR